MRTVLAALLAGTTMTAAAWAETDAPETMAYPVPARGMAAQYSNGATMTIVDVSDDGSVILIKEEHPEWGETYVRYVYGLGRLSMQWNDEAGLPFAVIRSLDEQQFAAVWPLTPGHSVSYTMLELESGGVEETIAATLEVLPPQTVTTPLGEDLAWIVRVDHDIDGTTDRRNTYDLWFSEGFPLPVRVDMRLSYEGPEPSEDSYELVGFTLPD